MEITTDRLIICPYQKKDFAAIAKLLEEPLVMKFSMKGPIGQEEAEHYIETFFMIPLKKNLGLWPIFKKDNQELIGFAGLIEQTIQGQDYVELGYRLHPNYWGQGYAYEACVAICDYAARKLHLEDLISIIDPENLASIKLSQKLKFTFDQFMSHQDKKILVFLKKLRR